VVQYLFWRTFGVAPETAVTLIPLAIAVILSAALCVVPLLIAEKRLTAIGESR